MAHKHSVYDTDAHFKIDPITREITNLATTKSKLMQGDHNSERFTFEIARLVEGHDMSQIDKIEIHYTNTDNKTKEQSKGVYIAKDMQSSPNDDDVVIFSWLISKKATKYAGSLSFRITFKCLTGTTIDYSWNTAQFGSISIGDGQDNSEDVAAEFTPDVLEQLRGEKGDPGPAGPAGPTGATGPAGFSVTVDVDEIEGGHKVTITDINGAKSFNVMDGEGVAEIDALIGEGV